VFTDNPFCGDGRGNFDAAYLSYTEEGLLTSYFCKLDFPDNIFLILCMGLIYLALHGVFYVCFVYYALPSIYVEKKF